MVPAAKIDSIRKTTGAGFAGKSER
jgi:hypothetical protein